MAARSALSTLLSKSLPIMCSYLADARITVPRFAFAKRQAPP